MKGNRLYKFEKLCSKMRINSLFAANKGFIEFPFRVVWYVRNRNQIRTYIPNDCNAQIMVVIPKKKLRHAVDRVELRRKTLEAYRLNRNNFYSNIKSKLIEDNSIIEVAFIYLYDGKKNYASIEKHIINALDKISLGLNDIDNVRN